MSPLARSATIGFATGIRSVSPATVVCWAASTDRLAVPPSLEPLRRASIARNVGLVALAEVVIDKLPWVPRRTLLPLLLWRMAVGAFLGSVISMSEGDDRIPGAIAGMAGAVAGAYGGLAVRTALVERLDVPDLPAGIAGDILAPTLSLQAVRR